jgi:hypothetical protein
LIQIEE